MPSTHEVTNQGSDRTQLTPMATKAREAMDAEDLTVVADAGYFKREGILSCHKAGIIANVPKMDTSGKRTKGMFERKALGFTPPSRTHLKRPIMCQEVCHAKTQRILAGV
jgi:hypothetical protein